MRVVQALESGPKTSRQLVELFTLPELMDFGFGAGRRFGDALADLVTCGYLAQRGRFYELGARGRRLLRQRGTGGGELTQAM